MHITLMEASGNKGGYAYYRMEEHPVSCISQHVEQEMQACIVGKAIRKGLTSLLMACILSGRFADWG